MFYNGLGAIAAARRCQETRSSSNNQRQKAKQCLRKLENWLGEGKVNCHVMVKLLRAEISSVESKKANDDAVQSNYDAAIVTAANLDFLQYGDFLQYRALGNELSGRHLVRLGDNLWASSSLSEARNLYSNWGAEAKVKQMNVIYRKWIDGSNHHYANEASDGGGSSCGGSKARERLSKSPSSKVSWRHGSAVVDDLQNEEAAYRNSLQGFSLPVKQEAALPV